MSTIAGTSRELAGANAVNPSAPLTAAPIAQPVAKPRSPFYAPGGENGSTAPDVIRKSYFDYVNDMRSRGLDTPNPLDKTGMPERDPYSGQAWTPSGAAQFQQDMAQAHRPFAGGEGLTKWEDNFTYQRMNPGQATTAQHAGNFLTTKGQFADDFAMKNMNRVSDSAKTAYKERTHEFDVAFSELLTRRGGSLTADDATGIAEELYAQFGDQIGRHMQNRISTTLQRSNPDVWQEIQRRKEEGMVRGNAIYKKQPDNVRNQIDLDMEILRNADPSTQVATIAERYGMAPGMTAGSLVAPLEKLFGLKPEKSNPYEPTPIGNIQIGQGVSVEMMDNGTQRIDPSWAEKTNDPAKIMDAYRQMLDEDKKATDEGSRPLLSPADRARYQERADAYKKALSAPTVQPNVSPTTKPAAQPSQPERKVVKAAKRDIPWLVDPPALNTSGPNAIPTMAEFKRDMAKLESHIMDAFGLSDSARAAQHEKDTKSAEASYREHAKTGDYHRIPTSWLKRHQGEYNDIPARLLK